MLVAPCGMSAEFRKMLATPRIMSATICLMFALNHKGGLMCSLNFLGFSTCYWVIWKVRAESAPLTQAPYRSLVPLCLEYGGDH